MPAPEDDDLELAIEAEDLAQVTPQVLDVVADAAHAELAEVRQVLADLGGVQAELLGQAARRDGVDAGRLERLERPEVDRQPRGRELRDRLAVGALPGRPFHTPHCSCARSGRPQTAASIGPHGPPCVGTGFVRGLGNARLPALRAGQPGAGRVHAQGGHHRGPLRPAVRGLDGLPGPAGRADGQRLDSRSRCWPSRS